jgi:hypothetical protein
MKGKEKGMKETKDRNKCKDKEVRRKRKRGMRRARMEGRRCRIEMKRGCSRMK